MTLTDFLSYAALYFVLWWLVLFTVLPFSLRTQEDEGEVTLGTVASAPNGRHMGRAAIRTTIISALVFGLYILVTVGFGYTLNDIPRIVPDYTSGAS